MKNTLVLKADCFTENRRWQGPEKRWGMGERADTNEARERLLSAARFCYERLGIVSTSMADIAAQAKVTRPTVYRYFKSRQEVQNLVLRAELDRFWWRLEREIEPGLPFGEYLVEALNYLLNNVAGELLFSAQAYNHLQELLITDCAIPGRGHHPVYSYALRPGARIPVDVPVAIEWFNRLALSYLACPSPPAENQRELLTALCPWAKPAIKAGNIGAGDADSHPTI